MRLDRTRAETTATCKWQAKARKLMHQRPEKHNDGACTFRRFDIHVLETKFFRWDDFEIVVFEPATFHADTFEYFDDTVDLFDARNAT